MLAKIDADRSLPGPLKRRAMLLESRVDQPALVVNRLQKIALDYLPTLPRTEPTAALVKVLSADTFWRHYSRPEVHDAFLTADDFSSFVERRTDPDGFLNDSLTLFDPVIAWERSWLTTVVALRGLSAEETIRVLEMNANSPVVLLEMSRASLVAAGVTIRHTCSLDSVLGPHYQWREGGPISGAPEYIDGPIPRAAVTSTVWRQ